MILKQVSHNAELDSDFLLKLSHDSMCVARKKPMHSANHSATCFKYRQGRSSKDSCRFGMPRDLLSEFKVDDLGIINLTRNNGWVNPWNPAIASCIHSNHNISWIPTKSKSLSLMDYVTNYATKDPTAKDLRLRENGMGNFALRSFNALSRDREISGVQVASTLLQLSSHYTVKYNICLALLTRVEGVKKVTRWWLRRRILEQFRLADDS
jgi:hypothetical protein